MAVSRIRGFDTGWVALPLASGWTAFTTCAFRRYPDGLVLFRGQVRSTNGDITSTISAGLPSYLGFAAGHRLFRCSEASVDMRRVDLRSTGDLVAYGIMSSSSSIHLDAIRYYTTSHYLAA